MDRKSLEKIRNQLKVKPADSTERLVLQAAPAAPSPARAPTPDQFPTRLDYRKALIAHENRRATPDLDALVERLHALGLETRVSRPSQTVVVEGKPAALRQALEQDGVEDAQFDAEIELIRPVKPDDADP
ncbi:MAG: hypothetical protein EP318_08485 [Rhodobacteraceae bacterium]|nr:MAG: hypothetical protein EP318_08485 [Paracoccaceae bacterium]